MSRSRKYINRKTWGGDTGLTGKRAGNKNNDNNFKNITHKLERRQGKMEVYKQFTLTS